MRIDSGRSRSTEQKDGAATPVRQAPSLRQMLRRNLTVLAVSCAMFALGYAAMSLYTSAVDPVREQASEVAETSDSAGQVRQLVQRFDCWNGEAPADMAGEFPGHVIVTEAGALNPVRGGAALVSRAFEQVFDGVDHGLRIHAFCR